MLPSLPANGAGSISPPPPTIAASGAPPDHNQQPPTSQRPPLRCPRCDSTNTKFCYYNNYSLSQPRHFCKSCRRYWTHGGALRNVPIGGGSRKSKKPRSSSRSGLTVDGALKLFQGGGIPSSPAPVFDFHLGSLSNTPFPLPRLYQPNPNNLSPFGDLNLTPLAGSNFPNFLGLNFNYSNNNNSNDEEGGGGGGGGSLFASSIESLSSLNQELRWKLQQQRMAVLYDGGAGCGGDDLANPCEAVTTTTTSQMEEKPQPMFFQNLEVTTTNAANPNTPTPVPEVGMHQWFFDGSYGSASGSAGCENDGNERRLRNAGGYVLDKDGVIKFQPYAEWLAMKKV